MTGVGPCLHWYGTSTDHDQGGVVVSIGEIREWDLGALDSLVTALTRRADTLTELDAQLGSIGELNGWEGDAGDAARRDFVRVRDDVTDKAAAVGAVRRLAIDTESSVEALKGALSEADYLASSYRFEIRPDNTVADLITDRSGLSAEELSDHDRMEVELTDRVEQIVRTGTDIETDAEKVLRAAADGKIDDRGASTAEEAARAGEDQGRLSRLDPPADGSPADNSAWWRALTDEQRAEILEQHPAMVGNLDGIPAAARNEANLALLETEEARLQQVARELQKELDDNFFGGAFSNADAGLAQTNEKLAALDAIRDQMSDGYGQPRDDRQLLLLDMTGEFPKAAVAHGDVDTADHVAVFVGGTGGTVADKPNEGNDLPTYVEQTGWLKAETEEQLKRAGRGEETVATIAWMGYEPPSNLAQASSPHYAVDNAPKLQDFLNGVDTSRTDDPRMTAIGHSYGSLVTSEALQHGTGVDAAVFMGSPGLDAEDGDVFGVPQMNLPSGEAYLLKAEEDFVGSQVAGTGWFGPNPDGMEGLTRLSTNEGMIPAHGDFPGESRKASTGHSEYTHGDTMSQYNQAIIVAGLPQELLVR